MIRDERAVSTAVNHALAIGITSILLTGLVIGAGQVMDDRRQHVTEQGLENVGAAVVSDLVRLDQFEPNTTDGNVSLATQHPTTVGDQPYAIRLIPDSERTTVHVNATGRADVDVPIRFDNETPVCQSRVDGGRVVAAYNATADCIEIGRSSP